MAVRRAWQSTHTITLAQDFASGPPAIRRARTPTVRLSCLLWVFSSGGRSQSIVRGPSQQPPPRISIADIGFDPGITDSSVRHTTQITPTEFYRKLRSAGEVA